MKLKSLVVRIVEVTPAHEWVHWASAFLLYRMEARYESLIFKDLLQEPSKAVEVAFQDRPGGPIPRDHWIPFLEPLGRLDLTPSERYRLEQLIIRFAGPDANPVLRTGPESRDPSTPNGRRTKQLSPSTQLSGPPMRKAPTTREHDRSEEPAENTVTQLHLLVEATRTTVPVTSDDESTRDGPAEAASPSKPISSPVEVAPLPASVDVVEREPETIADRSTRVDSPEQESLQLAPDQATPGLPPAGPLDATFSPPEENARSSGPGSPIEGSSALWIGVGPNTPTPAADMIAGVPVEVEARKSPKSKSAGPRKSSKAAKGVETGTGDSVASMPGPPEEIESYLARISQEILDRFRTRPESPGSRSDLDPAIRAAREETDSLRSEVQQLQSRLSEREVELSKVREALEAANHSGEAKSVKLAGLEELVAEAKARLPVAEEGQRRAEAEVERLKKEVDEALVMIEEAERRASDLVHSARLDAEETLRTFLAKLSRKIEPLLSEGMDDPSDRPELTPEQSKFHQRLRKILSVLRDLGMPPT
jgi:hypothetical protein